MNRRHSSTPLGTRFVWALVTAAIALPIAVSTQVKTGATAADVGLYQGADRIQTPR